MIHLALQQANEALREAVLLARCERGGKRRKEEARGQGSEGARGGRGGGENQRERAREIVRERENADENKE